MADPIGRADDVRWDGWGSAEQRVTLPDDVRALVEQVLGAEQLDTPPVAEQDVHLPEPFLGEPARRELIAAVGEGGVRQDRAARLRHAGGMSTVELLRRRNGDAGRPPDAVVAPAGHDEVVAVLATCTRHRIAVVPFGGGTSVVGGVKPARAGFTALIALDLGRMDRLREVDRESMIAVLQAGLRGPEAERLLAAHGFTLGHLPQSFGYATIGGFAATRSAGQSSAGYGRFDDMAQGLRLATPVGTLTLGRAPASAAGPDLRQLVLGSEGAFGVITEVTVGIRPLPERQTDEAWSFPDFATGVAALRRLAQAGTLPAVLRLSDETDTMIATVGGGASVSGCLAVTCYEGEPERLETTRTAASDVLTEAGGSALGGEPVADWRRHRFDAPYLRDALLDVGLLVETLETATYWSNLLPTYHVVREALSGALATPAGPPLVACHVSHVYPNGASLYFTVVATGATSQADDRIAAWQRAKRAASAAIAEAGATITHHHAIGCDHAEWMPAEVGELGVRVLRAVKDVLDPAGILNPGKLIPRE